MQRALKGTPERKCRHKAKNQKKSSGTFLLFWVFRAGVGGEQTDISSL
jgi:hypothetical protein